MISATAHSSFCITCQHIFKCKIKVKLYRLTSLLEKSIICCTDRKKPAEADSNLFSHWRSCIFIVGYDRGFVKLVYGQNNWYIVPLCYAHNSMSSDFSVNSEDLVPVNQ